MSSMTSAAAANLATTRTIYEAFGRGDVPAIQEVCAADVRFDAWADTFAQRAGVPWLTPRAGHDGVAEFFGVVGGLDISDFQVLSMVSGGDQVVVEVVIEARAPGNGGHFRDEELHLWTFNADGLVTRMRHYVDTAKHIAAAGGEDTMA